MKAIFEYTEYREYLRDYYAEKKASGKFSYRVFASQVGFSSPVFLKLVIEGKASLSEESIGKLCAALSLSKREAAYFEALVQLNQAKGGHSEVYYLKRLRELVLAGNIETLTSDHLEYFSKWYHSVIRELLDLVPDNRDPKTIAELLVPKVRHNDVVDSIDLLKKMGLVHLQADGQLRSQKRFLTSTPSMPPAVIRAFQHHMADLAIAALSSIPKEQRNISGATVGVSEKGFKSISAELDACRARILEIAREDVHANQVYRVNLHWFPLSKAIRSEDNPQGETKKTGNQTPDRGSGVGEDREK